MKKGDIVKVKAKVKGISNGLVRKIYRYKLATKYQITGIVLGYSFIYTGKVVSTGRYYDEPNYLDVEETHKVFVVEPTESYKTLLAWTEKEDKLIPTNRYIEPVRCFENDLEIIE